MDTRGGARRGYQRAIFPKIFQDLCNASVPADKYWVEPHV